MGAHPDASAVGLPVQAVFRIVYRPSEDPHFEFALFAELTYLAVA